MLFDLRNYAVLKNIFNYRFLQSWIIPLLLNIKITFNSKYRSMNVTLPPINRKMTLAGMTKYLQHIRR